MAVIVCRCWRALVRGRYSVIIIIKLEVNLKMTGWSKFAHTSGSIKLETFHECLKLEAVTPSVPVSGPGPGSLGRVLVSSELGQTRLGPARARVKTSQSCQFFWWVSSVRRGSAISLGNICSIKFSNPDTHTQRAIRDGKPVIPEVLKAQRLS